MKWTLLNHRLSCSISFWNVDILLTSNIMVPTSTFVHYNTDYFSPAGSNRWRRPRLRQKSWIEKREKNEVIIDTSRTFKEEGIRIILSGCHEDVMCVWQRQGRFAAMKRTVVIGGIALATTFLLWGTTLASSSAKTVYTRSSYGQLVSSTTLRQVFSLLFRFCFWVINILTHKKISIYVFSAVAWTPKKEL